ncbi:hypothetical protein FRB94_008814 [Tulasnella sp. JGI-2019a]|nr:hypothetical protein FRB94_008814 [Tulasnella sp. JGI-2019a]
MHIAEIRNPAGHFICEMIATKQDTEETHSISDDESFGSLDSDDRAVIAMRARMISLASPAIYNGIE